MLLTPAQQAFVALSMHAKIHNHLDSMDERYRTLLWRIESAELEAVDDSATYEELESLREELLRIQF